MSTFSFWEFKKFTKLEEIIEVLKENQVRKIEVDDSTWIYEGPQVEFNSIENYGIDNIKTLIVDNKVFRYIYFGGLAERTAHKSSWTNERGQLNPRENIIKSYTCEIMLFEQNACITGVFFRAKSSAERMIKYLFKEDVWGLIEEKQFGINEDLFYWLFHRVKDYSDEPLVEKTNMYITGLHSYIGKTKDNVNVVRGDGNRVAAMLGTVAFLFNNESLKAVSPEIQYNNNKILLEMSLAGTFKLKDSKAITGELADIDKIIQNFKVAIYISMELMPKLIECYKMSCIKKQWSPQMKLNFLKTLGNEIRDKVNSELGRIKEQISKEFALEVKEYEIDDCADEIDEILEDDEFMDVD